jgi:ribosomal protein S1
LINEKDIMQTLNLLPTGEGTIIKKNKYGFLVLIDDKKIFIHYSDTLNESIFDDTETPLKDLISEP